MLHVSTHVPHARWTVHEVQIWVFLGVGSMWVTDGHADNKL
jgi:hypothetical protein